MCEKFNGTLQGRKFRKLADIAYKDIRQEFNLKHIEVEILINMYENPGSSASDLCRDLNLNRGQVSQAMDSLCRKGMIQATASKRDRRYINYCIQPEGQKVIDHCIDVRTKVCEQLFEGISEEDWEIFKKITKKMFENIDKIIE